MGCVIAEQLRRFKPFWQRQQHQVQSLEGEKHDKRKKLRGWKWILMGIPKPHPAVKGALWCGELASAGVGDASQWPGYGRPHPGRGLRLAIS